jgi:hypothetical protein
MSSSKFSNEEEFTPGSCFGIGFGTKVMMYNGPDKDIEDVEEGDVVWGGDGKPHKVLYTYLGHDTLYLVRQGKNVVKPYVVSQDYKFNLKASGVAPVATTTSSGGYRVTRYIRCSPETCKNTKCTKKCIRKTEKSYKSREEAEAAKQQLKTNPSHDAVVAGNTFEVPLLDYVTVCQKDAVHRLKGYRNPRPVKGYDPDSKLPLPPYLLSLWLGDGHHISPTICTSDQEVIDYLRKYCKDIGDMEVVLTFYPPGTTSKGGIVSKMGYYQCSLREMYIKRGNRVYKALKELNLIGNKHIPEIYMQASEQNRLELFAGLIDTDGSVQGYDGNHELCKFSYAFGQTEEHRQLVNDAYRLAQTLGLGYSTIMSRKVYCSYSDTYKDGKEYHMFYYFNISGEKILDIPCKIVRKQIENICPDVRDRILNNTTASLYFERIDDPIYYEEEYNCKGIKVEGDGTFLLADCTVVNCN